MFNTIIGTTVLKVHLTFDLTVTSELLTFSPWSQTFTTGNNNKRPKVRNGST